MTGPMRRVQTRLQRPLEDFLRESYATRTLNEIAEELGVSQSTVHRWMTRYGIEARFPGQRPEEAAAS